MELARVELERFGLTGWWPTFVTDAGGNVQKAFSHRSYRSGSMADWSRCCCHLLHNVVQHGISCLTSLQGPTHIGCRTLGEALER